MMSAGRRGRARFDSTLSVILCQALCCQLFTLVFTYLQEQTAFLKSAILSFPFCDSEKV